MSSSEKKAVIKAEYRNLRTILLAELDRIMATEECDIHRAFVHETARIFSSTASGFSLTDGSNEWGIDFCRTDAPVFTMAQCKCPERTFLESGDKPRQYDRDALEDLLTGINFVSDTHNPYPKASLDLKQFKTAYHGSSHEWPKETRLQAALAIFGQLSPQAENYFRNQRNELESRAIELLLWDWTKFNEFLTTPQIDLEHMKLTFVIDDPTKDILKRPAPLCFVRGIDIVHAWNEYQWNLVDWNVRAEIRNSPTNKRIQDTLLTPSGRRRFVDYNNGLLVVCKQVRYRDLPDRKIQMTLRQPQIVNGCQTLLSLVRAYTDLPPKQQEDFDEKVRVQLKIVANKQPEFVEKIVQSTNDQNPMSMRSLKANTIEQRELQESFSRFFVRYFYERKDGQFEGLINFGQRTPSFRPSDYKIAQGRRKYRTIDNESLAQEWLAFIGFSDQTLRGGLRIFETDDLYRKAFLAHPKTSFWDSIGKTPAKAPPVESDDLFEEGSPSVSQHLLAHTVANIVRLRRVSFQKNRASAIKRLARKGRLRVDDQGRTLDDPLTVDSTLNKDEQYFRGTVTNNMRDVIIELYGMILCMKYGPLDDEKCVAILRYPTIRPHVENPNADIGDDAHKADSKHILNLIYEFILFSLDQYLIKYGDAVRAQPSSPWQKSVFRSSDQAARTISELRR